MYSGNNPIALKSQQWLAETLLELMETKPYTEISIKDICNHADLSRQTFYNFFESKEELFRFLLRSSYEDKLNSFDRILTSNEAVVAFITTVSENHKLVDAIAKNNLGNLVADEIFNSITHFLSRFVPNIDTNKDYAYHIVLLSGALTHFLLYYAKQNDDISEKELTRILESFLSGKLFRLIKTLRKYKKYNP